MPVTCSLYSQSTVTAGLSHCSTPMIITKPTSKLSRSGFWLLDN